jgi:hypothetical protein
MRTCLIFLLFSLGFSCGFGSEQQALELANQVNGFVEKYKDEVKIYHESGGRLTDEFDPFFALLLYECELLVPEDKAPPQAISLENRMLSVQLIRSRTSIILMASASTFGDSDAYSKTNELLKDWSRVFVALNDYEKSIIRRYVEASNVE